MLRLASDADVHGDIIRGLRRRSQDIDLVRVQDALPEGTPDPEVLAWAAAQDRVLITNDRNTMVGVAYPDADVVPILRAVNTAFDPVTIHEPTDAEYKEFLTGRRYTWAHDRVM